MAIAKKACKCTRCRHPIAIGDKMRFARGESVNRHGGNGTILSRKTIWLPRCDDQTACFKRIEWEIDK